MQQTTTYPATLDDMIFEGRNKAYGAYVLRRLYDQHIGQATLYALLLSLLFFSVPTLANYFKKDKAIVAGIKKEPDVKWVPVKLPEAKPIEKVTPVEPAAPAPAAPTVKDVTIQVVDDNEPVVDVIPTQAQLMTANAGKVTSEGTGGENLNNPEPGNGTGSGTGVGTGNSAEPAAPEIFYSVENMPQFEGGLSKLMEFVGKNLRYPRQAQANSVEGTVVVGFVVSATGDVTDIQILKGLGYGTEEEVTRVLKKLPRWKPGNQNGRNVSVKMTLPIRLELR